VFPRFLEYKTTRAPHRVPRVYESLDYMRVSDKKDEIPGLG